jgi:integrase
MATIRAVVSHHKKEDGTYNVRIRITHHQQTKMLPTTHFVTDAQITRGTRKIKDIRLQEILNNTISTYQHIVDSLGWRAEEMTCDEIVNYIKNERAKARPFTLPMADYMLKVAERRIDRTASPYQCCAAAIMRYTDGEDVDIKDITAKWLQGFQNFLETEPSFFGYGYKGETMHKNTPKKPSTIKLYFDALRSAHNEAKKEYNDEDRGLIRIASSPFSRFKYNPIIAYKKKSINREDLLKLWEWKGEGKLKSFARDIFFISFLTMGMNVADLFVLKAPKNGVLIYNRQKTKKRRADEAYMEVRVEPELEEFLAKYKGKGGYAFDFRERYSDKTYLTQGVNTALAEICEELGLEPMTFYWARHSWATIAYNDIGTDKYVVHEALCHIAQETKITDVYIRKSWDRVWECNRKVIDYLFGE